jgi:protein-tyrosine phosphatase
MPKSEPPVARQTNFWMELASPRKVWTREEVLQRPCPVPVVAGVYAWWFREIPPTVPSEGCITTNGLTLLYIGIAPSRDGSSATLRSRIRQHYRSNASGSTLRLTLGCLLAKQLGIALCPVGTKRRLTFGEGERKLSEWIAANAFVCWVEHQAPWEVEAGIIGQLRPPLNLADSSHHFRATLREMRQEAKRNARIAPRSEGRKPEVLILSEQKARLYEPSGREVCISITNPDGAVPSLSSRFVATLRVAFTDIAKPSPFKWDLLFNHEHAKQIIDFVREWEGVERVVIHCMAGQSRSPGVAMGLCELLAWDLSDLEQRYPLWNTWVRQELVRVGKELLDDRQVKD